MDKCLKKQMIQIKDRSILEFTLDMTFIVNIIYNKNKKDTDIEEIRDGYLLAKNENPECIIINAGPYLWKYREQVSLDNFNELLNNDFSTETSNSNSNKVQAILNKIKKTWHLFKPLEQDSIKKRLKTMLTYYATYLKSCKHLE